MGTPERLLVALEVSVGLAAQFTVRDGHINDTVTGQDCSQAVQTFPVCVDPTANMYAWGGEYFCCAQGSTGIYPSLGYPFCQAGVSSVPTSLLATMVCVGC